MAKLYYDDDDDGEGWLKGRDGGRKDGHERETIISELHYTEGVVVCVCVCWVAGCFRTGQCSPAQLEPSGKDAPSQPDTGPTSGLTRAHTHTSKL